MSISVWIVNLVVLAVVLEADLGHKKITRFRLIRPLVLAAAVAVFYIGGIVGSGTSLWLELGGVGAGIVLGLAASALMRVYADADREPWSLAGPPYAALWIVVVGARLWFGYASNHSLRIPVGTWMFLHHVTSAVMVDAFIFMAIAMVLTRTASLFVRSRALRGSPPVTSGTTNETTPSPASRQERPAA
jgi:hypothetical protein